MRNFLAPSASLLRPVKPVIQFYEEGDWLRIEAVGKKTRYMRKETAIQFLSLIGSLSQEAKDERRNN